MLGGPRGTSHLPAALQARPLLNLPGLREPHEPRRAPLGEGTTLKGDFHLRPSGVWGPRVVLAGGPAACFPACPNLVPSHLPALSSSARPRLTRRQALGLWTRDQRLLPPVLFAWQSGPCGRGQRGSRAHPTSPVALGTGWTECILPASSGKPFSQYILVSAVSLNVISGSKKDSEQCP